MAEKSVDEKLTSWKQALEITGFHLSWAKSSYQDILMLGLSKGEYYVSTEVTELGMKLNPNILAQKVENMLKSLKYPENTFGATSTTQLESPLKVEPPQAESLEQLYANADWDAIVKNNKKGKSKPKSKTAAEIEANIKFWKTPDSFTQEAKHPSWSQMFADSPMQKHLKGK